MPKFEFSKDFQREGKVVRVVPFYLQILLYSCRLVALLSAYLLGVGFVLVGVLPLCLPKMERG